MSSTSNEHASSGHHDHSHGSLGLYLSVTVALLILTALSFGVAQSPVMDTPALGWVLMMTISCMKALLVMLCFMHLWWEANWKYVLTFPAMAMSLFLFCMLVPDVGLRNRNVDRDTNQLQAMPVAHADHAEHPHDASEQDAAH